MGSFSYWFNVFKNDKIDKNKCLMGKGGRESGQYVFHRFDNGSYRTGGIVFGGGCDSRGSDSWCHGRVSCLQAIHKVDKVSKSMKGGPV